MTARPACRVAAASLLLLAGAPGIAAAQRGLNLGGSVSLTSLEARSTGVSLPDVATGIVLGAEGRLSLGPLAMRVGYGQGHLREQGGEARRLFVQGFALLGAEPLAGLEIAGGPYVRAHVADSTSQRRIVWRLRVRYEAAIGSPLIRGYVEASGGVPDRGAEDPFTSWRGGVVGLELHPGDGALGFGISYGIDEARPAGGTARETVEGISVRVSYSPR